METFIMVGRVKGGKSWHERQSRDHGVKQAKQNNYRNRAAIKLIEINDKFKLLQKDSVVIELGSAPGGWTQVMAPKVKQLIACDLLPMVPVSGATFFQGDFVSEAIQSLMLAELKHPINLICSDMAPNLCGIREADHAKMAAIVFEIIAFSDRHLAKGGSLLFKYFESSDVQVEIKKLKSKFKKIQRFKPPTSRSESAECYLIANCKK